MAEQLFKLSPDRDLQCYFLTPSAIAALSNASPSGFTLSGKWRQQFDWAVLEWNRDNVFEHPSLRYLPDGDLSGLVLSYEETRSNCVPLESNLVPTVSWNTLRIWTDESTSPFEVDLAPLATPVVGSYVPASATMTLTQSPGAGLRVGLAWMERHYYYTVQAGDSLSAIAAGIAANIIDTDFSAASSGNAVIISCKSGPSLQALRGANGNRITVYGFAENGAKCWETSTAAFRGGAFPTRYRIQIDFSALHDRSGVAIPTNRVRKLRWTWAADLQSGSFEQQEFAVVFSAWTVSGGNRLYSVAGPGSFRIEDTAAAAHYTGSWLTESGNYSDSRIHYTATTGDSVTISYSAPFAHRLFLGTRLLGSGATLAINVDGNPPAAITTSVPGEDILVRCPLGAPAAGSHTVTITHNGLPGTVAYFDFLEVVAPTNVLPDFNADRQLSLATDWDTYHAQSLPAERTAWMIRKLGFHGRVNHYTGALWFYEIRRPGTVYASLTFDVVPAPGTGSIGLDIAVSPGQPVTTLRHLVLPDDTAETAACALAGLVNNGTNLVWASANGSKLSLTARYMGSDGNGIYAGPSSFNQGFTIAAQSTTLSGGITAAPYTLDSNDGLSATLMSQADLWRTDLAASPRLNRAARDWHLAFFRALRSYGLDCVAAFSTELMNGDPAPEAGLAQLYPDGTPAVLNTPAIQTNFSPLAVSFWKQVYLDMAALQQSAGMTPYLQSGEVQWWYFPKPGVGMSFYDSYTKQQYTAKFGTDLPIFVGNTDQPGTHAAACTFLAEMIGSYTSTIRSALQAEYPNCRYEVLYPTDTNNYPLTSVVNYPSDWTAANLTCLKTESFGFTASCDLDLCERSMSTSGAKGFPPSQRSHLVGIESSFMPWMKEVRMAQSQNLESVVLFALDQFCLVGYPAPPFTNSSTASHQG